MVLDLTGIEFLGTVGFSELQSLHRLLQLFDPESALNAQPTVDAASDESAPLLQLVAESG